MSTYSTYKPKIKYEYTCPECKATESSNKKPKTCVKCGIELCKTCARKHHHFCIWCYNEIANEYLWKHKFTTFFLAFLPILVLFLPAPLPMIILLFTSFRMELLIIMFIYLGMVVPFCIILRVFYKKKMKESIISTDRKFNRDI